jgi:hypothetical protein
MIYAIKEAKKRCPYNGFITLWSVITLLNVYLYYIECIEKSPETAEGNFQWCKRYYNEVYAEIEPTISKRNLAEHHSEAMRSAYVSDKLNGIVPSMDIFEFLDELKK